MFNEAIDFVLRHEGGYSHNPRDPGGETNFGISKRSYPALDIKNLTRDQATAIYRRDFWEALGLDAMPRPAGRSAFDTAVNCGPYRAVILLQSALNTMSGGQVAADGALGPKTRARIRELPEPLDIADELLFMRLEHYRKIATGNKSDFLRGWLGRVLRLREIIKHMED